MPTVDYTIPSYDGMEFRFFATPNAHGGFRLSGILFDESANILSEISPILYIDYCHVCAIGYAMHGMLAGTGLPEREWSDGIWDSVYAGMGMNCHCEYDDTLDD